MVASSIKPTNPPRTKEEKRSRTVFVRPSNNPNGIISFTSPSPIPRFEVANQRNNKIVVPNILPKIAEDKVCGENHKCKVVIVVRMIMNISGRIRVRRSIKNRTISRQTMARVRVELTIAEGWVDNG